MNSYEMRIKKRTTRHDGHKCETDRYELEWHGMVETSGDYTVKKSVWATAPTFGYNSNHIDWLDVRENHVKVIYNESLKALNFKFRNTIKNSKFLP